MSIPKEPRQQMINLMYLVLTALLALNVSAEILAAFQKINDGVDENLGILSTSNERYMASFKEKAEDPREAAKAKPFYDKAVLAVNETQALYNELEGHAQALIELGGGIREENGRISKEGDLNSGAIYMVTQKKGTEIMNRVNEVRAKLLELVYTENDPALDSMSDSAKIKFKQQRDDIAAKITLGIDAEAKDDQNRGWVEQSFMDVPLVACVTNVKSLQSDVKSAESIMIDHFRNQIGKMDLKFDKFKAQVVAPSNYMLKGDRMEAEIFLSAFSSTASNYDIFAGGSKLTVEGGKATVPLSTGSVGAKSVGGKIVVTNPETGEVDDYEYKFDYFVGQAAASISADAMRVFYIGLDNPVSITVSGYDDKNVSASFSGGGLTKQGPAKYVCRPASKPGKYQLTVSAKGAEGGASFSTSEEFRVLPIPDPNATIAGRTGGKIPAGLLKTQSGIRASLKGFVFDVKFSVQGFEMLYAGKKAGGDLKRVLNKGASFGPEAKRLIQGAQLGDRFIFDNIKIRKPDGKTSTASIALRVAS